MISLEAARINAGLTQERFAEKAGVTVQTVNRWEKGKTIIDAPSFMLLSKLSGIPAENIIIPKKK